jgi:colanic acid biosynthesis glycosyl transferase WcaI
MVTGIDGEVADVITRSGAGFAARAGDPQSLATAIRAMADASPEQRTEMGARGKAYYAEHFDRELLLTRLLGFLREAVTRAYSSDRQSRMGS